MHESPRTPCRYQLRIAYAYTHAPHQQHSHLLHVGIKCACITSTAFTFAHLLLLELASVPGRDCKHAQAGHAHWQASQAGTANVPRQGTGKCSQAGNRRRPQAGDSGCSHAGNCRHCKSLATICHQPQGATPPPTSRVLCDELACLLTGRGAIVNEVLTNKVPQLFVTKLQPKPSFLAAQKRFNRLNSGRSMVKCKLYDLIERSKERGKKRRKGNRKWSFGRNGKKIANTLAGIEPGTFSNVCYLGTRFDFQLGRLAIFSISATASLPISFSPFLSFSCRLYT